MRAHLTAAALAHNARLSCRGRVFSPSLCATIASDRISPWHDIPLHAAGSTINEMTFHFVCEIPKGDKAKFEIHKSYGANPLAQDHKKGKARYYKYGPSLVNYGALSQTWEDPARVHPDTGAGGDNDPIDVLQINDRSCKIGEVMPVRVLGTLALVDGGETDWKVIVVDTRDVDADHLKQIEDVDEGHISKMREWFRNYKTAEGKGLNTFGLDEKAMPREYAERVILETHESWKKLVTNEMSSTRACPPARPTKEEGMGCSCMFDDEPCWIARAKSTLKREGLNEIVHPPA